MTWIFPLYWRLKFTLDMKHFPVCWGFLSVATWRWQPYWTYFHFILNFLFSLFIFLLYYPPAFFSQFPLLILSSVVADPCRQHALFCQSATVYQSKHTNGWQFKAINSFKVDPLCAWHQPPWLLSLKAGRSIAAIVWPPNHKTLALHLQLLVFKVYWKQQWL